MTRIDKACYERGCACYDDRVDGDAVEVVLAQTQEPVAVVSGYYGGQCVILPIDPARIFNSNTALYPHPPQRTWVGLTDEEENEYNYLGPDMHWVIQEIAAKLKEKNT